MSCSGNPAINLGIMMKIIKAVLDFVSIPIKTKPTFFKNVLAHLTDNPYFINFDVPLSTLRLAVENLELAILAAEDGSHTAKSAMHDSDIAVTLMFKHLVGYVNRIANGDETKLLSSGFNVSGQPAPRNKAELAIKDGPHSGSAKVVRRLIPKAGAYRWDIRLITKAGLKGDWGLYTITTQSSIIIEGLETGSILEVKSAGVTPVGITDFCASVSKLIN